MGRLSEIALGTLATAARNAFVAAGGRVRAARSKFEFSAAIEEHIVASGAPAVHADGDQINLDAGGKRLADDQCHREGISSGRRTRHRLHHLIRALDGAGGVWTVIKKVFHGYASFWQQSIKANVSFQALHDAPGKFGEWPEWVKTCHLGNGCYLQFYISARAISYATNCLPTKEEPRPAR